MCQSSIQDIRIDQVKGVGPKTVQKLIQLGIETVEDLFFHIPFRYEDLQEREITSLLDQEKVVLRGTVVSPPLVSFYGNKKSRLWFKMAVDEYNIISVVFFNQHYLKNSIVLGESVAVYGKWQANRQELLAMKLLGKQSSQDFSPIYRTVQGLKQGQIQKIIRQAFVDYGSLIEEDLPDYVNGYFDLLPLNQALYAMHFPANDQEYQYAKHKLKVREAFIYQWQLQGMKHDQETQKGYQIHYDLDQLRRAIQAIPFELTKSQKQAVNAICYDFLQVYPMQRLLQGDVGSGKTLVAFLAMIATVSAGFQACLMAPTEILAIQHQVAFNRYFEAVGLHAELLTSQMDPTQKSQVISGLKTGRIRLVIGTHALFQAGVSYKDLAFVVIDEQHRFGVGQRQALSEKAAGDFKANNLQMTATPIPRSLAQTLYANLNVTSLEELPSGRQPIETKLLEEGQMDQVFESIQDQVEKGHQVYYVLPMIQSSDAMADVENVENVVLTLKQRFPNYRIGLLHGQLSKEAQLFSMDQFKKGEMAILVATSMVEVGVDVPNATLMVIQSAERFGLAQLHQLRGRVGRSNLPSYCLLVAQIKTEQAKKRLQMMTESQDGFALSKEDLKIRGMGDILGRNQSGLPEFQLIHPIEDQELLVNTYKMVAYLQSHLENLSSMEQQRLNTLLTRTKMEY